MTWQTQQIGPKKMVFGRNAVMALTALPPDKRQCLTDFFRALQVRSVEVSLLSVGNANWIAHCGQIVIFSKDMARVLDVAPAP